MFLKHIVHDFIYCKYRITLKFDYSLHWASGTLQLALTWALMPMTTLAISVKIQVQVTMATMTGGTMSRRTMTLMLTEVSTLTRRLTETMVPVCSPSSFVIPPH
jgi:hypothetical protein